MDTLEGRYTTQTDINRLEEWANRNLMAYKVDKFQVLLLGTNTCNGIG